MRPHLVLNPASAAGRTGRHVDHIARAVRRAVGEFDLSFTQRRGDGVALARDAARAGSGLVVAVGGDGTASEVVDGLVQAARTGAVFGFIPRGTGGDLRRTLGVPEDVEAAASALQAGADLVMDLGRVELTGHDGAPVTRTFANVAGFGIAGEVVRQVERTGKAFGGRTAFMLASGKALLGWRDVPVRWRIDGGPWREERITSVSVCNGRFFGGGMMVAPGARVDDGLFDVTVWKGLGLADFVLRKGMLYDGSHVRLPNTTALRGAVVEAEPLDGDPILLDVDGEQPGRLPARFTMLPGALCARVPRTSA
ncbi:MAG TPA: diacylglycerol kinase family protein [Anaeromyxobacteraceae bacterium]|nr:diacylglycerol kinase family protein [Anaeromyxobacteraceae bacterium]